MTRASRALSTAGRDAAVRRLRIANRSLAGLMVGLTVVLTDVAARAFPGYPALSIRVTNHHHARAAGRRQVKRGTHSARPDSDPESPAPASVSQGTRANASSGSTSTRTSGSSRPLSPPASVPAPAPPAPATAPVASGGS